MKKSLFYLLTFPVLLTSVCVTSPCCKKYNGQYNQKEINLYDTGQLLTAAPWKLLSFGYDNNDDDRIDAAEENITPCQKSNIYRFNANGSGSIVKDKIICGNEAEPSVFSWSFTNNKTIIDFFYGKLFIAAISNDSMVLTDTNTLPAKLILTYSH